MVRLYFATWFINVVLCVTEPRRVCPSLRERPSEDFYQHLLSSVGVGYNGRVSRLFTITAVCPENLYQEHKETLQQIIDTFEIPPGSL